VAVSSWKWSLRLATSRNLRRRRRLKARRRLEVRPPLGLPIPSLLPPRLRTIRPAGLRKSAWDKVLATAFPFLPPLQRRDVIPNRTAGEPPIPSPIPWDEGMEAGR
jgi:hypothetical protein